MINIYNIENIFRNDHIKVIAIDADDTLWYDAMYLVLLKKKFVQLFDGLYKEDTINNMIVRNRITSGEQGFVNAIITIAQNLSLCRDKMVILNDEINKFINHSIVLLPYVKQVINQLSKYRLILVTQGGRDIQNRKVINSGLEEKFDEKYIFTKKGFIECKRFLKHECIRSDQMLVIGNSLRHDIIPATQIGAHCIWLDHRWNEFGRDDTWSDVAPKITSWKTILEILGGNHK
jgi:putative hydrolase of the HAD superfamily